MMTSLAVKHFGDRIDGRFGYLAGRQHDPDGARFFELPDEVFEIARARCSLSGNCGNCFVVLVVNDGVMTSIFYQTADNIRAHSSQADHAYLH